VYVESQIGGKIICVVNLIKLSKEINILAVNVKTKNSMSVSLGCIIRFKNTYVQKHALTFVRLPTYLQTRINFINKHIVRDT